MDVFVPAAAIYNQVWSTNLIFCVLYSDPVTDDSRCLAGVLSGNAAFAGYGNGAAAHGCIGLYGKNALQ